MYLFAQLASYLFVTFLLGIGVGYALWRAWGEREAIAKYNAAEMRLAAHLARWEKSQQHDASAASARALALRAGGQDVSRGGAEMRWEETARRELHEFEAKHTAELHEFEAKQTALMRDAEDTAVRKAEAAAEKKLADLARRLGEDFKGPGTAMGSNMGSVMGAGLGVAAGVGSAMASQFAAPHLVGGRQPASANGSPPFVSRTADEGGPRLPLAGAPIIDPHANSAEVQYDTNGEQVGS